MLWNIVQKFAICSVVWFFTEFACEIRPFAHTLLSQLSFELKFSLANRFRFILSSLHTGSFPLEVRHSSLSSRLDQLFCIEMKNVAFNFHDARLNLLRSLSI